ncbi:hypothetical protein [uncultured Shimia sp.]|uniref:hypothetical protein n=1 Tax=uncultured Shimia sp. TaxID=573152 RepID=UPI0026117CE4|nr:hypothetical protein [uncultured Shimia sp.]
MVPRLDGFDPVGADFGPDGRLFILERGFNGVGFRSRVRRFDVTEGGAQNEVEVLRTGTGCMTIWKGWRFGGIQWVSSG